MTAKDEVIARIPKLSKADWAEAERWARQQGLIGAQPRQAQVHDWLFQGIASFLMKSGQIVSPAMLESRSQSIKSYKQKAPEVIRWLEKQLPRDQRYRRQFAFICAKALADLEVQRGYFSVGAMLSGVDKIPEALEAAFPGYTRNNLLHKVVEQQHASTR